MNKLAIAFLILLIGTTMSGCVGERQDKMSTLTETQIAKLYGRSKPFIPSGYRLHIQEKLDWIDRRASAGRFNASQIEETARNIERENPSVRLLLPPPEQVSVKTGGGAAGKKDIRFIPFYREYHREIIMHPHRRIG